jgi:DNA-binding NtrC family response regulator
MLRAKKVRLRSARSYRDALASLAGGENPVSAIICEERLPDGTWLDVMNSVAKDSRRPPLLIVASRVADAALWGSVLNVGGYDLLAKPFNETEVQWVLESALVDGILAGASATHLRGAA